MSKLSDVQWTELRTLISQKLVTARKHSLLPLTIYNYSPKAISIAPVDWSDVFMMARGLVLDLKGEIIARPFRKFWNYDDGPGYPFPSYVASNRPDQVLIPPDVVHEKMDGSLISVSQYRNTLGHKYRIVASRGSFESEQAIAAELFLKLYHSTFMPELGVTHVYEWISPDNRIVVDYGSKETLVCLGVVNNWSGDIVPRPPRPEGMPCPEVSYFLTPELAADSMKSVSGCDGEGYVMFWHGRDGAPDFRLKIKSEDYRRLHKVMTGTSLKGLWEAYKAGKPLECPSFVDSNSMLGKWIPVVNSELVSQYRGISDHVMADYMTVLRMKHRGLSRKQIAKFIVTTKFAGLVFAQMDGKTDFMSDRIWDTVWKQLPVICPDLQTMGGGSDGVPDSEA